jgi:hypothetical protein
MLNERVASRNTASNINYRAGCFTIRARWDIAPAGAWPMTAPRRSRFKEDAKN